MIGVRAGIVSGVRPGLAAGLVADPISAGNAIVFGNFTTQDVASGKFFPASSAEYTAANFAAPASIWLCQEPSGNAADSVGANTLTAAGTPAYNQAVAGYTRTGFGMTDGTASQGFSATTVPDASTTSLLMLAVVAIVSTTTTRSIFGFATTADDCEITASPRIRHLEAATGTNGTVNPIGVRFCVLKRDRTNSASLLYTDQEKIVGTFAGTTTGAKVAIGAKATLPCTFTCMYAALWTGANAEMPDSTVKTLLQRMGNTISWS